ncbi:MAG: nitroreductase family protein [Clostridia bacterium]|nr:nitroreductase family protein [Clostridia bacterium]
MKPITINPGLCIGCGKCVEDCVSEKLGIVNGKAQFMYERCIQCGHCFAICPMGAVSMTAYENVEDIKPLNMSEFDSDKLLLAMKSRRSVRQFRNKEVSDEMIEKIIEAGRYCPTGTNAQDFSFTVVRDTLPELEKEAVKFFRLGQKAATPFSGYIKNMTIDEHFFFKGAPVVIVVSGKGDTSACLASSYMELMAESMGLGVLYSGFFVAAAKLNRKISAMLELEKGHSPVTTLVIGWPDVEYKRIPPRNKAKVNYK